MPTRASKQSTRRDFTQIAKAVVDAATGDGPPIQPDTRNQAAVALSKLGAAKGGAARAKQLTAHQRKEIAKRAAASRWGKRTTMAKKSGKRFPQSDRGIAPSVRGIAMIPCREANLGPNGYDLIGIVTNCRLPVIPCKSQLKVYVCIGCDDGQNPPSGVVVNLEILSPSGYLAGAGIMRVNKWESFGQVAGDISCEVIFPEVGLYLMRLSHEDVPLLHQYLPVALRTAS